MKTNGKAEYLEDAGLNWLQRVYITLPKFTDAKMSSLNLSRKFSQIITYSIFKYNVESNNNELKVYKAKRRMRVSLTRLDLPRDCMVVVL